MDRLNASNSVAIGQADVAPSTGTRQYATDGNPVTSTPATIFPAYWANMIQDEIRKVITDAGITPDDTNWGQLSLAIQTLINSTAPRIRLGANATVYISPAGNDTTGNGSSGNPWKTRAKAFAYIQQNLDIAGNTVVIQMEDGTYTDSFVASGPVLGQTQPTQILFNGNSTTPSNVVINPSSGDGFLAAFGGMFAVQNCLMENSGGGNCINASDFGAIYLQAGIIFGASPGGAHIFANAGLIQVTQSYSIIGGAAYHLETSNPGAQIGMGSGITVTLTGTPNFTGAFANAHLLGMTGVQIPAPTFSGAATGVRYLANGNGVISVSGGGANYFPGNSAGATSTGGQYF